MAAGFDPLGGVRSMQNFEVYGQPATSESGIKEPKAPLLFSDGFMKIRHRHRVREI